MANYICPVDVSTSHFDPISATVWNHWTNAATTANAIWTAWTTNATTPNVVWDAWTGTSNGFVWTTWNGLSGTSTYMTDRRGNTYTMDAYAAPPLSEDELRRRRAEYEEQMVRQRADRDQAVQRAETLLHEHLNERQRRSLLRRGKFRVKGQSGRWYEIARGHHSNVWELDHRGKRVSNLCVYATDGVPEADSMLAQALYLRSNEEHIRRVAHISLA